MAAQQAAELYEEAKVHVIPSKNVGAGYVSLASADLGNPDPEIVEKSFISALENVAAGYVSPSIRDADINGVHVNNGDTIGIIGKEIVVSEKEKLVAAVKLAERLMADPDKFMLSVFCGKDTTIEENDLLQARIEDACPGAEVYFIDGGQDIYPYIFVAE
jgi:dihydroxyacetone kinase-like predicted kinase